MSALAERIRAGLREHADPDKVAEMQAYMKTEQPFLGVQKKGRVAAMRGVRTALGSREEWEQAMDALWSGPHREEQYCAIDLAQLGGDWLDGEQLPRFEGWIRQGAWWDLVDGVAAWLVGPILLRAARLALLDAWIEDPDLWIRRSALIAQIKAREQTDTERLFRFCELCAPERSFWIRKAIGWALRSHSYTDPQAVIDFVEAHPELSGLSRREALKVIRRKGLA